MSHLQTLLDDLLCGDEIRAEDAAIQLGALDEEAIPPLLELTHSPDADHRWWATRALAQTPHTRTSYLVPLLDDPAPEVRAAAALALCNHPGEEAIPALARVLGDADSVAAQLAGSALSGIGSAATPALLEVMKDAPQNARIQAMRALAEIRDPRSIPIMMKVLEEDSVLLQYWAKEGLERLGMDMVYIKPA